MDSTDPGTGRPNPRPLLHGRPRFPQPALDTARTPMTLKKPYASWQVTRGPP